MPSLELEEAISCYACRAISLPLGAPGSRQARPLGFIELDSPLDAGQRRSLKTAIVPDKEYLQSLLRPSLGAAFP